MLNLRSTAVTAVLALSLTLSFAPAPLDASALEEASAPVTELGLHPSQDAGPAMDPNG